MTGFDPYDALIQAMERLQRLEQAHNQLAIAHAQSQKEFTAALQTLHHLQQSHLLSLRSIDILAGHVKQDK